MTRKWLPSDWMDEMPPTPGDSPDAFLKRNADGVLQLAPIDNDDAADARDMQPGAEVPFTWYEPRGWSTLTIREDWTWFISPDFDADTNCFRDDAGEYEDIFPTLQDLVDNARENGNEPGQCEIEGWTWSEDVLFEVRVLESGAAEFVEVQQPADAGHPYGIEHPVTS